MRELPSQGDILMVKSSVYWVGRSWLQENVLKNPEADGVISRSAHSFHPQIHSLTSGSIRKKEHIIWDPIAS